MEGCPLCLSYMSVTPDTPCPICDLRLVPFAPQHVAAIIPGVACFEPARPEFARAAVQRLIPSTQRIVIDLSEIRYFSSDRLNVVVALLAAAKERDGGRQLVLAHARPNLIRMLQICRLSDGFRIVERIEDGLQVE